MGYFNGKTFLVTGASSGIGRELALQLSARGAAVVVTARRKGKLDELIGEAKKNGGAPIFAQVGDVTKASECKKAVRLALKECKMLDGVIHNAGISMRALAEDAEATVYKQLMDVNFFALMYLYKAGIASLKERSGHFVVISSMMGKFASQTRSGYAASKHAAQGFMDSVRLELIGDGVHVMTVSPGFVQTDISLSALSSDGSKHGEMGSQERGLPVDKVARMIIEGMIARKRDLYPSGLKEKTALFLSKWAPSLLDKILYRVKVT